ncbi:hypothetical protein CGLO_03462 [Colletotrichum gloeosporioides Cg-14]|uniref:DUF6604 domain-containing protein n=1 Tax=Colletotrichum gloeosporioides (strain Cg-14) TaxID=1237896 RepID=T0KWM6_COLGC|nr:hypothetical protein CGLO_03462 [Colletotrichum gloeosporioides Cg-14]
MDYSELSSSYKQYKLKTNQALDWLIREAKALRVTANAPRQFKVWELVDLATACANAGRVMPKEIRRALEESLCLRRRCAEWFLEHGSEAANTAHKYFNDSLQQILDTLAPSKAETGDAARPAASRTTSKPSSVVPPAQETSHTNYFAVLGDDGNVRDSSSDEDGSAGFPTGNAIVRPARAANRKTRRQQRRTQDEQGGWAAFDDDHLMELSCLLNDCRDIRLYLQRLWVEYASGKVDLITASLMTQAGFEHLVDLETVFTQKHPKLDNLDSMTDALYSYYALGDGALRGETATEDEKLQAEEISPRLNKDQWLFSHGMKKWLLCDVSFALKFLNSDKMRSRCENQSMCFTDSATFGLDPLEFFALMALRDESLAATDGWSYLDLLTKRMAEEELEPPLLPVRLSTAAMCRIYLDILYISGLTSRLYTDLLRYLDHRPLKRLRERANEGMKDNNEVARNMCLRFTLLNGSTGQPTILNPIILGSVLCSLALPAHLGQIYRVNESGALMAVTHQYNALRIMRPITVPRWQDLEVLIELQKQSIFAPEPPQTFDQCVIRFWRSQGLRLAEIKQKTTTAARLRLAAQRVIPLSRHQREIEKTEVSRAEVLRTLNFQIKCESQRNTAGFRRELRSAALLEHLFCQVDVTPHWKLSLSDKVVRDAVDADLRSLWAGQRPGKRPPSAVDLPAVVWLGQLQKMFQRETADLWFDYKQLEMDVTALLGEDGASSEHVAEFFEKPNGGLSQWMNRMSDKSRLTVVSDHWKAWCKQLGIVLPPNVQ